MEDKVRTLIAQLPPGERVIATLDLVNCRLGFTMGHVVDLACIGHCFSYANYEPASMVFRIRATPGNRIVTADEEDSFAMQKGNYRMKPEELPAGQMYFCGTKVTGICLQPLPPPPGYESPPATRPSW